MNTVFEQFNANSQAQLKTLEGLAQKTFAGAEKLVELNVSATKAAMTDSFAHAKALMAAKDAQEVLKLNSGYVAPLTEKSVAYFQNVQSIASSTGAEWAKSLQAQSEEAQKNLSGMVDKLSQNAPAGTEAAVSVLKNAMVAGQQAVESAQSSAKKVMEATQANLNSATAQAVEAVKKATAVAA